MQPRQSTVHESPAAPAATELQTIHLPRIGQLWREQGGIFAGLAAGQNPSEQYALILGPELPKPMKWEAAIQWSKTLTIDGHSDFDLPNRSDGSVLFGNLKSSFAADWYWLNEQSAGDGAYAWCQSFYDGGQNDTRKSLQLRARAVRRSII